MQGSRSLWLGSPSVGCVLMSDPQPSPLQSERTVLQLMHTIQTYRADGVTYGMSWQTNPLVSHSNPSPNPEP